MKNIKFIYKKVTMTKNRLQKYKTETLKSLRVNSSNKEQLNSCTRLNLHNQKTFPWVVGNTKTS